MQVAELATKFSFGGSLKPLDSLNQGLTTGIGSIAKVASIFTVAGVALNGFLVNTLANADAQVQLSRNTGVSIESIQELGYVASVSGSNAQAMEKTMDSLSRKIGEAAIQGSEDFSRLGISVRDGAGNVKKADVIFGEVSASMKRMGMSAQEQKGMMGKLGIDESLLQTMQLTGSEMDKLRNKAAALGTISEKDGNAIVSFNDSLTTLKFGLDNVQKRLAIAFAPQLSTLADGFTDLLVANKDMIQNGLKKFFELVNTGLGAIFKFGMMIYNLIDGTVGIGNAFMIAGAAMLYLNRAMFMNPVGLIIAGIVALIVIFDDLTNGLIGGQSVIADWFQEWLNIDILAVIRGIGDAFSGMIDGITGTFSSMFTFLRSGFNSYVDFIKGIVDQIIEFFQPVLDIMSGISNFKMPEIPSLSSLNPFSDDGQGLLSSLNPFSDDSKKLSTPAGSSSNNSTQNNAINIEIKSDNPQLAGQQVSIELQGMLNNANVQFNKGGL